MGKKLEEIDGHFIWVLHKLLDDPELIFAVACALVKRDRITRHALVNPATPIVARHIRDTWNGRTILASRGLLVKRDVAASACVTVRIRYIMWEERTPAYNSRDHSGCQHTHKHRGSCDRNWWFHRP